MGYALGKADGRAEGKAVGRGVSREGWTRAKPKKIPVRPSLFNGPRDESGRLAIHYISIVLDLRSDGFMAEEGSCGVVGQDIPVGIPKNLAPLPNPCVTHPSKWIG